jgi:flagellar hook-associated protein 3 FlgL
MRITQRYLIDSSVDRVQQNQDALDQIRAQIANGRRIQRPEDDPQATQQAINLRAQLATVQTSLTNINYSSDWMSATEAALNSITDILGDAQVRALQLANDTYSAETRETLSSEVKELFKQVIDIGNLENGGQSLFAGYKVDQKPFTANMDDLTYTYSGDSGVISHELETGNRVAINVAGSDALFSQTLTALKNFYDALQINDTAAIRTSVNELDEALDTTLQRQGDIGSRMKGIDAVIKRLNQYELNIQNLISKAEDVDMAEASLQLASYEQGYQATLASISRVMPGYSLFDYLG